MSRIAIYEPENEIVANRVVQYLISADINIVSQQYENILNNPNVPSCEFKYWKKYGSNVIEMNAGEKAAVDQAEADKQAQIEANAKDIDMLEKASRVLAVLTFKEINKLRQNAGLSEYTWTQFKTAFITEWDALS